jgi:hypothetical protein
LLFFDTPQDANQVLEARPSPIHQVSISKENKMPAVAGSFVIGQNPVKKMSYVLFAGNLSCDIDEKRIVDVLELHGLPRPTHVKVNRGQVVQSPDGEEGFKFWRQYAEVKGLVPLTDKLAS